jgi:hypothetical protein
MPSDWRASRPPLNHADRPQADDFLCRAGQMDFDDEVDVHVGIGLLLRQALPTIRSRALSNCREISLERPQ